MITFALFFAFIVFNRRFQVCSDPPTVWRGLITLGIALLFTMQYGTLGFYLLDRHFSMPFSFWKAISQTGRLFSEFVESAQIATIRYGRYELARFCLSQISSISFLLAGR